MCRKMYLMPQSLNPGQPGPSCSVGSIGDLRTGGRKFEPLAQPIFFPRIDDSHCSRIHVSLTAVHCFDDDYVRKQPVAWKEYCAEYCLRELWDSMDRCTGCCDINEIKLKKTFNTIHTISQSIQTEY